jgi:hypothetical protein
MESKEKALRAKKPSVTEIGASEGLGIPLAWPDQRHYVSSEALTDGYDACSVTTERT